MFERTMRFEDFKLVGTVGVDAGCVVLCDPCYILPDIRRWIGTDHEESARNDSAAKRDYSDMLDLLGGPDYDYNKPLEPWGEGMGIIVNSGYGDGTYGVYTREVDNGDGWGKRVRQVMIDFMGDLNTEDDYYEEDDEEE